MMEVHIDDALGLFPNFIGYEGDAPSHIDEYDNLNLFLVMKVFGMVRNHIG